MIPWEKNIWRALLRSKQPLSKLLSMYPFYLSVDCWVKLFRNGKTVESTSGMDTMFDFIILPSQYPGFRCIYCVGYWGPCFSVQCSFSLLWWREVNYCLQETSVLLLLPSSLHPFRIICLSQSWRSWWHLCLSPNSMLQCNLHFHGLIVF